MELILGRNDLRPEFAEVACSQTRFEHFSSAAQSAMRAVGDGLFREPATYNRITVPRAETLPVCRIAIGYIAESDGVDGDFWTASTFFVRGDPSALMERLERCRVTLAQDAWAQEQSLDPTEIEFKVEVWDCAAELAAGEKYLDQLEEE